MNKLLDLRKYDFKEPYCVEGYLIKSRYGHVWRNYYLDKSKLLNLKGLSLLIFKLTMPFVSTLEKPCVENTYVS